MTNDVKQLVRARLDIEVFVNCPHCDYLIDLLKEEDTAGTAHNDEGYVLSQACPEGHWTTEHKSFQVEDVECSDCGKVLDRKSNV